MTKLLLAAALLAPAVLNAGETACLYDLRGRVEVRCPGSGDWERAGKGMPLREGCSVRTDRRSFCEILLKDGTFVRLDAESEAGLDSLRADEKERSFSFSALRGKTLWLAARVSKGLLSRFSVRTPTAVCAVRGTDFSVVVSTHGDTSVGMFEGVVSVAAAEEERTIAAGSEARISAGRLAVQDRLSRLMQAEEKRYSKVKSRVERLRKRLSERDGRLDDFIRRRDSRMEDFDTRRKEKLDR